MLSSRKPLLVSIREARSFRLYVLGLLWLADGAAFRRKAKASSINWAAHHGRIRTSALDAKKVNFTGNLNWRTAPRTAQLTITAKIADGWHIFSTTQEAGGPKPSKLKLKSDLIKLTGPFSPNHPPSIGSKEDIWPGLALEEFHEQVIWTAPFELVGDGDATKSEIQIDFDGQACEEACIEVREKITATFAGYYGSAERALRSNRRKHHATWTATLTPTKLKPGQSGKIVIKAVPDEN